MAGLELVSLVEAGWAVRGGAVGVVKRAGDGTEAGIKTTRFTLEKSGTTLAWRASVSASRGAGSRSLALGLLKDDCGSLRALALLAPAVPGAVGSGLHPIARKTDGALHLELSAELRAEPARDLLSIATFGPRLPHCLASSLGLHLTKLKVKQLGEELSMRGAPKSGRKRALQLRLRALIIAAAAAAVAGEE